MQLNAEREPHPVGMVNVKDDTSKICKVRRIHLHRCIDGSGPEKTEDLIRDRTGCGRKLFELDNDISARLGPSPRRGSRLARAASRGGAVASGFTHYGRLAVYRLLYKYTILSPPSFNIILS